MVTLDGIAAAPRDPAASAPAPDSARSRDWRIQMLLLAMVAVTIFFGSINHYYLTFAHFLDMGRQASLLTVVALGATFVIVSGEIDLSVGAVVGLVSVAVAALFDLDLSTPVVVVLALLAGTLAGVLNGFVTLVLRIPSFLTTLGTMAILRGLAIYISDQPRQILDDNFAATFGSDFGGLPQSILYSAVLVLLTWGVWRSSRFGLRLRAVGSSLQGARFAGLPTQRIKFVVFILAGLFSAAGALLLLGRTQTGLAVGAEGLELNAIAAVILGGGRLGGGKASIIGTLLAALLLTMVFSGIAGMGLSAAWQLLTKGSILVIVIILMRR